MADVFTPLTQALRTPLAGCYLVSSDQPLLIREACHRIMRLATQAGYHRLPSEVIDSNYDWAQLTNELAYRSLLNTQQIQVLHQTHTKLTQAVYATLTAYAKQAPRHRCLVLCTPKLTSAQQKTAGYRQLKQHAQVILLNPPNTYGLAAWIQQRARHQGLKLSTPAIQQLSTATLGDIEVIEQILMQLKLCYPPPHATPIQLNELMPALQYGGEVTVFNIIQSIEQQDALTVRRVLVQCRQQGTAPPLVLWCLNRTLRQWLDWAIQSQQGHRLDTLIKPSWPARIQTIRRLLAKLSIPQLQHAIIWASRIDRQIKGVTESATIDIWSELTALSLSLCHITLPTPLQLAS